MLLQEIVMSKTMTRKSKIRNNKEEKGIQFIQSAALKIFSDYMPIKEVGLC